MTRAGLASVPTFLRITADAVMSVVALSAAMLGALFAAARSGPDHGAVMAAFLNGLGVQLPILVALSVACYAAYGVYGRVRFLPARDKALQLLGAATLAYAAFGLVQRVLPGTVQLQLPELLWAWALAAAFMIGSRFWSTTWRALTLAEAGLTRITGSGVADSGAEPRGRQRVLVIGGGGYVGSALVPRLLRAGYRVRVLDLLLFGDDPIAAFAGDPDFELFRADFRQVDRVVAAMEDVDAVVHLGGLVGDPACSLDPRLTTEVNLDYTRLIAEVAKGERVPRFVFASSCSVYGASDETLDEDSLLNPVSLYARSKIASENILFEMATREFAPTVLRFGTVYGLSGRSRFDLVVNLLSAKAVVDGKITVFGGDQWRPFVHVEDAARAVEMVLQAPAERVRNEIFNVGSDAQNATLGDVGRLIQRLVPTAELIDSGRDGDRRNYRVSFAKIRATLGFLPEWSLEQGVRQVVEALRSGAVRDYTDPVHSNVRFLTEGKAPRYVRVRTDWATQRMDGDATHSSRAQAEVRMRALDAAEPAAEVPAEAPTEAPAAAGEPAERAGAAGRRRRARALRKPGPVRS